MADEDQIDTVDTSIDDGLETAVEATLGDEHDPQEEIVTIEQPSLAAAPL